MAGRFGYSHYNNEGEAKSLSPVRPVINSSSNARSNQWKFTEKIQCNDEQRCTRSSSKCNSKNDQRKTRNKRCQSKIRGKKS